MAKSSGVTLSPNILNRVSKLPKPANNSQGLQPLFEAISNAFYAVEDLFGDAVAKCGKVIIEVKNLNDPNSLEIIVSDNGIGLDEKRYDAFCEVDTTFKKAKGGKGVGRLFWLDAFSRIEIESYFKNEEDKIYVRKFQFRLANHDQIILDTRARVEAGRTSGTKIIFSGLKGEEYSTYFPKRENTFLRYFSAHFIADFLVGFCPAVTLIVDGNKHEFPQAVSSLVIGGPLATTTFDSEEFGSISVASFACRKEASAGLEGSHNLHLLADGRTVESREIDGLMGIKTFSHNQVSDLVFHGCISGDFLNKRVNEGRTAFTFTEKIMKSLIRECAKHIKEQVLNAQMLEYIAHREASYDDFIGRYPIYGFDDRETQLNRIPFNALEPEDFAAGLVKHQIRREEKRQNQMQNAIEILQEKEDIPASFAETVISAARELQETEKLSLAQHVVRRKLVLDLLDRLISRVRAQGDKPDDYHLEETLHSFICPMRVNGTDPKDIESTQHDLWIVDERLAFTKSFSSDRRLDTVIKENESPLRPDLLLWNLAHGLTTVDPRHMDDNVDVSQPLGKVMIVEFKRPGRESYGKVEDNIEQQIIKYLTQLKNGEIENFQRERIRIGKDCVFHCYVVADIIGDLEGQLRGWPTTANGQGRLRMLGNDFAGSTIEVIQWRDLVNDAWSRNESTLNAAGLRRSKPIPIKANTAPKTGKG